MVLNIVYLDVVFYFLGIKDKTLGRRPLSEAKPPNGLNIRVSND